jgi:hypothetical protein
VEQRGESPFLGAATRSTSSRSAPVLYGSRSIVIPGTEDRFGGQLDILNVKAVGMDQGDGRRWNGTIAPSIDARGA